MTEAEEKALAFEQDIPEHRADSKLMFEYNETPGNLFDYENKYTLAHCISADFALNTGIAQFFQARYSTRDELRRHFRNEWKGHGYCLVTNENHVINLVTKNRYYEKPTYETVKEALIHMMEICRERKIKKVAMPRIGCGLDRLEWQPIRDIIQQYCADPDFEIRVVYLHEYLDGKILDPDTEKLNFGKDRQHIDGNVEKKYY